MQQGLRFTPCNAGSRLEDAATGTNRLLPSANGCVRSGIRVLNVKANVLRVNYLRWLYVKTAFLQVRQISDVPVNMSGPEVLLAHEPRVMRAV
jgi:hypothetical protein